MSKRSALVTGGSGCLGYHIVQRLLADPSFKSVHVLDIKIRNWSRHAGAVYHEGDLLSHETVSALLAEIKPTVILHAASPPAFGTKEAERRMFITNVAGTKNLLDRAVESGRVQAFLYTSSVNSLQGYTFNRATEDHPIRTADSTGDVYGKSKAIADEMVRAYNNPQRGFRTACLRMCQLYGVGDIYLVKGVLNKLNTGELKYQIGDNTCLYDFISAPNAANAHVLSANALLDRREQVDGEAFFITDGRPITYWDWERSVLAAAGYKTAANEIYVIPQWFALGLATIIEWVYWIFTFGTKEPATWRRWIIQAICTTRTFSIQKISERVGFTPQDNRAEVIRDAVAWAYREGFVWHKAQASAQ